MENQLKNYSFQRLGRSYVKGYDKRGRKEYGFKETYRTKAGDFSPEEWRKTVLQAIDDAGETDLLEKIKEHCRKHCAWLRKEKDIEEYSMECLVGRAYLHWEDFKGGVQMSETKNEQVEVVETVPAKMEFRLINPTEDGFLRTIKWNREELEAAVRAKVASYQNVVYTEDNLKQAKADRAELNKLTDAIEERRKRVKSIIMEPYTTFEAEVKEVLELIKEPVSLIDAQIKAFEDQQREEKKKSIRESYEEVIGDLAAVLPFEKVFESRYLNKTYKLGTAQADVKRKVEKVRTDLETIDSLDSKYKLNAKDVYIKTLDLSKALAENKRLSDLEEKLEAEKRRKAEQEAERKRREEEQRRQEEARRAEEERQREEEARIEVEQVAQNQIVPEDVQDGTNQPETGISGMKSASEPAETGTIPWENESAPVSPMGRAIESIERQAFTAAVDPFAPKPEKKARVRFFAIGTKAQLKGLVDYMKENNIKYGKVE